MTTNALDSLLGRITDPDLRRALEGEIGVLRDNKDFGLVFERHLPEEVRLLSHPISRGVNVQERKTDSDETWTVDSVSAGVATLLDEEGKSSKRPIDELVVVRGFGEPIYPGLKSVGKVERGGDKPYHSVINGENFYALETLLYAYEGQVDCIYIDPPYNSGARDWKYNNDYVDGEDAYRHSKWLSFMEKRLQLAKRLLKEDSLLVVTIDEKEVHHLGMLLEALFPNAVRQLVTIVINPLGQARKQELGRVEEYAFFIFLGAAGPSSVPDDLLTAVTASNRSSKVRWEWLIRGGTHSQRRERPNLFFPVFVDPVLHKIHSIGDSLAVDADGTNVRIPKGMVAVWPLNTNGNEGNWRCSPDYLRELVANGYAKVGAYDKNLNRYSILYLGKAQVRRIESGELVIKGRDANNVAHVVAAEDQQRLVTAKTVWNRLTHRAGEHGSALLKKFVPGTDFPFPKSVYAVKDTLQIATLGNPEALIIDFFAGSGTTAHAAMLLNKEDGGQRRTVSVTNNEVSAEDAATLRARGLFPGEVDWEARGIFEHVILPRIRAAVTGRTAAGKEVEGNYRLFADEFPIADGFEENVEFFELTYLDHNSVARGKAFEAVAPLLWMKFGAFGPIIAKAKKPFVVSTSANYAVLFDINRWPEFVAALRDRDDVRFACIVTDSLAQFQQVVAELPPTIGVSMLYEDYLRNFEINTGDER